MHRAHAARPEQLHAGLPEWPTGRSDLHRSPDDLDHMLGRRARRLVHLGRIANDQRREDRRAELLSGENQLSLLCQAPPGRELVWADAIPPGHRILGSPPSPASERNSPTSTGSGGQTFLQDGRVEIDSNVVENFIRPIALTRKNALFAGYDEGGRIWGRIASLIATAKINGVEPFAHRR